MRWLLHHHDWPYIHEGNFGLQVHWFGRFAGYADWRIERSRLTAHMVAFFFAKFSPCWCELNGTRHNLKAGDLLIIRGADEFVFD